MENFVAWMPSPNLITSTSGVGFEKPPNGKIFFCFASSNTSKLSEIAGVAAVVDNS